MRRNESLKYKNNMFMDNTIQTKQQYASPTCEELDVRTEGVIAASGGLGDDEYEKEKW